MIKKFEVFLLVFMAVSGCAKAPQKTSELADQGSSPSAIVVPAGTYRLDPMHAHLQWSIPHGETSNYFARFGKYDGIIKLDPKDITKSSLEFTIAADSVDTGYPGDYKASHPKTGFETWDAEIGRSARFLDGTRNPVITFRSVKVAQTAPGKGAVTGNLTFRGITKTVTMDVTLVGQAKRHMLLKVPVIGFRAEGELIRADFGMAKDFLGPLVKVYFEGEFLKEGGAADPVGKARR